MSTGSHRKVQISESYVWSNPEIVRFVQAVQETLLPFAGDGCRFNGDLEQGGPPTVREGFEVVDDWSSKLQSSTPDSIHVSVDSSDWSRSIYVTAEPAANRIYVRINIPFDESEAATALLENLRNNLALTSETEAARRNFVGLERAFQIVKPRESEWIKQVLTIALPEIRESDYFSGYFLLVSAPDSRHTQSDINTFKSAVVKHWDRISKVGFDFRGKSRKVWLEYDLDASEVRLEVQALTEEQVENTFLLLQQELKLKAVETVGDKESFIGSRRNYFTKRTLDQAWFENAMTILRSQLQGRISFDGRYRLAQSEHQEAIRSDFGVWKRDVLTNWNQIIEVYCWQRGRNLQMRVQFYPQKDLVDLEIEGRTSEEAEAIVSQLVDSLQIEPINTQDPYRYRQSGDDFEIVWNSEGFAQVY